MTGQIRRVFRGSYLTAPALIFLLAFAVRFAYLNQIRTSPLFLPSEITLDEYLYDNWARDIAFKDPIGKEAFWGLPLYPYFLGLIYFVFGRHIYLAKLIHFIIGALNCVLLYTIGRRIFNKTVGALAGITLAFYNAAIFYEGFLISSALAIFMNCLLVLLLVSLYKTPDYKKSLLFGITLGLAGLTAPSGFFLIPFLFFAFRGRLRYILIALACCVITIAPVTIRNYVIEKDFLPITAHNGITFYAGNNPSSNGSFNLPPILGTDVNTIRDNSRAIAEKTMKRKLKPSEISAFWFRESGTFIKNRPLAYAKLLFKKFLLFWNHDEISDICDIAFFKRFAWILGLPLINYAFISSLSILGIILALFGKNRGYLPLIYFIAANIISLMLYFVNTRYRLPVVPFLILFSSYALYTLLRYILKKNYKKSGILLLALLPIYLIGSAKLTRPSMEVFYTNLGIFYTKRNMYDEAVREYKTALELNPSYPFVHINLGFLYLDKKLYKDAAGEFKKTLQLIPDYPVGHNNLGIAYKNMGMVQEAAAEYKKAIALNPGYASPYYNLGVIYLEQGLPDQAAENFKKALSLNPGLAEAKEKLDRLNLVEGAGHE